MQCRGCYLASLTDDERERAASERPTMPSWLCAEHQAALDDLMDRVMWGKIQVARTRPTLALIQDVPA